MSGSERKTLFVKLAKRLLALAGPQGEPAAGNGPASRDGGRSPAAPSARSDWTAVAPLHSLSQPALHDDRLTIRLERRGPDLIHHYHLQSGEVFSPPPLPWHELEAETVELGRRLDEMGHRALSRFLDDKATAMGTLVFRLLLGDQERWEPVLRSVFGRPLPAPRPTPTFGAVRMRIASEDPLLLGLPWRLASWQGQILAENGWTFSTTGEVEPTADLLTVTPPAILAVLPRATGNGDTPLQADHAKAIECAFSGQSTSLAPWRISTDSFAALSPSPSGGTSGPSPRPAAPAPARWPSLGPGRSATRRTA
jgi:hypothetical protein